MTFNRFIVVAMLCMMACVVGASRAEAQQADTAATPAPVTAAAAQPAPLPEGLTDDERLLVRRIDQRVAQLLTLLLDTPDAKNTPDATDETAAKEDPDLNAAAVRLWRLRFGEPDAKDEPPPKESPDQQAARSALLAMHDDFATRLVRLLDADDPPATAETRARVADTLALAARETREAVTLSYLTDAQREAVAELRRIQPRLYAEGLGVDLPRRAAAIEALTAKNVPLPQAEPLLMLALRSAHDRLRTPAMHAIGGQHHSRELEDLLLSIALQRNSSNAEQAFHLLKLWKSPRLAPHLLAMLKQLDNDPRDIARFVILLADVNDARCVPPLVAMLEQASAKVSASLTIMEKTYTLSDADMPLYLLIRLTGQSLDDYNVTPMFQWQTDLGGRMLGARGGLMDMPYGFLKGSDRQEAIGKFQAWYAQNKDRYANLPDMALPELDPRRWAIGSPWPDDRAAAVWGQHQKPSPEHAEVFDTAALREELSRALSRIVPELNADSPAARARAQQRLRALHDRMTDPLVAVARARDDRQADTARALLLYMAALSEGLSYAATLDGPGRTKLLRFRAEQNEIFRLYFSLEEPRQKTIMEQLSYSREIGSHAEPLVLLGLGHENEAIRRYANLCVASGRYRDGQAVDRHCDAIASGTLSVDAETEAVKSLRLLNDPRATRLLLKRLTTLKLSGRGDDGDKRLAAAYVHALAAADDPRLVPVLIECLDQHNDVHGLTDAGRSMTFCLNDYYLHLLLRLTRQSPETYQFLPIGNTFLSPTNGDATPGFSGDAETSRKARAAAHENMRQWWEKRKDLPPYKDAKPFDVR